LTCLFHFCNFTFYICDWSYFVPFHFPFVFIFDTHFNINTECERSQISN
jgi:hypothetical protein